MYFDQIIEERKDTRQCCALCHLAWFGCHLAFKLTTMVVWSGSLETRPFKSPCIWYRRGPWRPCVYRNSMIPFFYPGLDICQLLKNPARVVLANTCCNKWLVIATSLVAWLISAEFIPLEKLEFLKINLLLRRVYQVLGTLYGKSKIVPLTSCSFLFP